MSLYKVADGLLGTNVTWEDVEEEMQKALETTARFGKDKRVTNIGDMKGFMSKIALVEPCWIGVEDGKELPERFTVKISSQLPFLEMSKLLDFNGNDVLSEERIQSMGAMTRMLHNKEVEVYNILAREQHPNIPITKIYSLKAFDDENTLKAFIISEFIPDVHNIGLHDSISAEDLLPVVRAAASFSAIGEKLDEEENTFACENGSFGIVFQQFLEETSARKMEAMIRNMFDEEHQEKVEKMLEINRTHYCTAKMLSRFASTCEFFGYRPVLTHSDLWSSNILGTKENGKFNLKAIIDFQTVAFTTPAQDIGRLFVTCLTTEERREKADFLIEEYYKTFVKELDETQVPYTLQQLKDSYQAYFPLMVMMVLPGIAPLLQHANVPEEYREIMKKMAMAKMVGLLEDFLTVHESSMQKFPEYFAV